MPRSYTQDPFDEKQEQSLFTLVHCRFVHDEIIPVILTPQTAELIASIAYPGSREGDEEYWKVGKKIYYCLDGCVSETDLEEEELISILNEIFLP